ncbi:restriction endonuclease subunit S [Legionella pneumophila serogroup 1]
MNYLAYKQYQEVKDSWFGKIPSSWNVKRLKYYTQLINQKTNFEYTDLPYIGLEHIEPWTGNRIHDDNAECDGIVCQFKPNDILFGKLRPYLAKVYLTNEDGCVSTEALVIRPNDQVHPKYLQYFMLSPEFIHVINSATYGVKMPRANWETIGNQIMLCPSIKEQTGIISFLEKKISDIDTLITKKQKLIQLLEEKRSALISQVVTKGLDPNEPMNDSGVNWLGKIPDGWDLKRIKFYVRSINKKIHYENTKLPYIGLENIESWTGKKIEDDSVTSEGVVCCFEANDVLFGKLRPYLAKTYLAKSDGTCSTEFLVFRPCAYVDPKYLQYFLLSPKFIDTVNASTYGAKMPRANWEFIANLYLTCPSLLVQKQIIQFLNDETVKIDLIKTKIKDAIERLKEYRAALITNAVTGKIALTAEKDKRFAYE